MKLYHVCQLENLESILKEGLKRPKGHSMVFLSEDPKSWYKDDGNHVVLEVDVDNLYGRFTTFLPELDEINYWGDIPPEYIKIKE